MATLVIKNVPDQLHAQLKRQALENRRSLAKEALTLIERAVAEDRTAQRRSLPKAVRPRNGLLTIEEIEDAISLGRE